MDSPDLTVIIPVYNEAPTIAAVLEAVSSVPFAAQVVVVDDGSTDGSAQVIEAWVRCGGIGAGRKFLRHPRNLGKGAAICTGLEHALGQVTLVQDADLEYDVADYPKIIGPILGGEADVVYGSRYLRPQNALPWTTNRACVHLLNGLVRLLYGLKVTDEATCYKAFRTSILRRMGLRCRRFEFCPEVTAKLGRMGLDIMEVPISYRPRSHGEGKKIRWTDGVEAISTLIYWRFARFRPAPPAADPSAVANLPMGIGGTGVA